MSETTEQTHSPGLAENALFDGDTGTRSAELRALLTTLLAERVFHGDAKPALWQVLVDHEDDVRSLLHDLYLDLVVSRDRRVAFKQQVRPDREHRVLLPARTTSVEFAAGVLLLVEEGRRATLADSVNRTVTRKAFNEAFELMWGTEVTNRVARSRNGNASIRALYEEGLLLGLKDGDEWQISPAIEVLYGPTEIAQLANSLTAADLELAAEEQDEATDEWEDA